MTDRRVGGDGLNVDINAPGDRRVGELGLQVDVAPPEARERQIDSIGLNIDFTYPKGVQYGVHGLQTDLVPLSTLRLANIGLLVEYTVSIGPPVGTVFWSTASGRFEMTGTDVVMWNPADRFEISGSYPIVVWNTDHFEEAP